MKLTDAIISAILKKGVMYEARDFVADVQLPDSKTTVQITIEHMTIKVEKD